MIRNQRRAAEDILVQVAAAIAIVIGIRAGVESVA